MSRFTLSMLIYGLISLLAFVICLFIGTVDIPADEVLNVLIGKGASKQSWEFIIVESRLPAVLTSLLAGAATATSGLLLQTMFNNPLAGPSILGISTASSLGVALVMLSMGGLASLWGQTAVFIGAFLGGLIVILLLLGLSTIIKSPVMLLITGILISYLSSSAISLLNFFASGEQIRSYVVWGLGGFNSVTNHDIMFFGGLTVILLSVCFLYIKPLNAMLLGPSYASSLGVNIKATRNSVLLLSGALTAIVTSYCGPIGFLGLVIPHIARLSLKSSNHKQLLPATILSGAAMGALCQLISVLPGKHGVIPINAITPVIGVPIIIYIILRRRSIAYFN